jgi:2-dehydro-3-deoxyphosphogluconate aldolase / (4S)-4-hydroxy-2-oxoglutarate aldolase
MGRFSRIEVAQKMHDIGLIPNFYHPDLNVCKRIIKTCYESGARVIEFSGTSEFIHDLFGDIYKFSTKEFPDIIIGAGSVIDENSAAQFIQKGAGFIVSPNLNESIARVCNRQKVLWIPGCGTVTEISKAEELGCEIVRIFPCQQVGGPEFIRVVKSAMPWSNIMPSGGIDPSRETIISWFEAGSYCVSMDSRIVTDDIVNTDNYAKLMADIHKALIIIKSIRHKK